MTATTAPMPSSSASSRSRLSSLELRRAAVGLVAGLVGSVVLGRTIGSASIAILLGALLGAGHGLGFRYRPGTAVDVVMTSASLGFLLWAAFSLVLFPVASGRPPAWTGSEMRALLPQLVAWVLYGGVVAAVTHALSCAVQRRWGPEVTRSTAPALPPRRILILGGGFAGVSAAWELERRLGSDRSVAVTLVSETNALLFTPMLAEVAGSSLEANHISCPLRGSLRRTEVIRGAVQSIDVAARRVVLATDPPVELTYDHLILTLGSVTNHLGLEGVARHTLGFKSLKEAARIRSQVIDAFERASVERDPIARRELLAFVIAGGGFAGVELAGALNDFARGMLADYPSLSADDVAVVVVHPGDRILPELSPSLAAYALERLAARGVTFRLGARVADARPGAFVLASGEEIRGRTLVWTAGTTPSPLLRRLGLELSKRGAVVVDHHLRVPRKPGVWAAGDCAAVVDARTGAACPPTAQFALREGRLLARNVHAALAGRRPAPFRFDSLGALCVVGYQTACAELRIPLTHRHVRFSGLLAWMMWRFIYLSKLPGLERKARVLTDWTFELFFPRDVVQTGLETEVHG
jgi:NADH dehydrogenase